MKYCFCIWPHASGPVAVIFPFSSKDASLDDFLDRRSGISDKRPNLISDSIPVLLDNIRAGHDEIGKVLIIKNNDCALTIDLLNQYVEVLIETDNVLDGNWLLCSPSGLGEDEKRYLSSYYSAAPVLPYQKSIKLIRDTLIDFYAINLATYQCIAESLSASVRDGFELTAINLGYINGFASVFQPGLSCPVNGAPLSRDLTRLVEDLRVLSRGRTSDEIIPSFLGDIRLGCELDAGKVAANETPIRLQSAYEQVRDDYLGPVSISVVTRTRFERLPFLNRFLSSIVRAGHEDVQVEVVISTDIPPAEAQSHLDKINASFPDLEINLVNNDTSGGCSRVRNLIGGYQAASYEYVWTMDDDDYVSPTAFEDLRAALMFGQRPFIFCSSTVMTEEWQHENNRSVLVSAVAENTYEAVNWKYQFGGSNQIPVCGFISPREHLLQQVEKMDFAYNLSEDYALILALLASSSLPEVMEINKPLSFISVRPGDDNTVTMTDRRPWTRDIHGFLNSLTGSKNLALPGFWDLMVARNQIERTFEDVHQRDYMQSVDALQKRNRELIKTIQLLERQVEQVRLKNTLFVRPERREEPVEVIESLAKADSEKNTDNPVQESEKTGPIKLVKDKGSFS